MAKSEAPVVIKKYANRRLYRTGTITNLTLEDLVFMVRNGEGFIVYHASDGQDIIASVLARSPLSRDLPGDRSRLH